MMKFVIDEMENLRYEFIGTPGEWVVTKKEFKIPSKKGRGKKTDKPKWIPSSIGGGHSTQYFPNLRIALNDVVKDLGKNIGIVNIEEAVSVEQDILNAVKSASEKVDAEFRKLQMKG